MVWREQEAARRQYTPGTPGPFRLSAHAVADLLARVIRTGVP